MASSEKREDQILKVSPSTPADKLASAISHGVYDGRQIVLRAIGAGAVNQAVKAIAIARSFVAPRGLDLSCRPGFTTVKMPDGQDISGIVFRIDSN
jgi:stage V sporulation protein S